MNTKWMTMAAAVMLAGCGSAQVRGDFPDPARAYPAGGTYVSLDGLRQYAPGMNKQQLYALLGTPHFGEGMWGVREWNYLFNFRRTVGAPPIQCQFQIHFDGKGVAVGQSWKPATPPPPPPRRRLPHPRRRCGFPPMRSSHSTAPNSPARDGRGWTKWSPAWARGWAPCR